MARTVIDVAGFEAKFQAEIDPWNYASSRFEAHKRDLLLQACGHGPFGRGLELACAIGETTRFLAPRCLKLTALDGSTTAIKEARRRTSAFTNITLEQAILPAQFPRGQFDLIVASEIFYYLQSCDLDRLLVKLDHALAPGGRIVILHHILDFDDAAIHPRLAQSRALDFFLARTRLVLHSTNNRFDLAAFVKPYR